MLGIVDRSTSYRRGLEIMEREFFDSALGGYLDVISRALTSIHPRGQSGQFRYAYADSRLAAQRQAIGQLVNSGTITANDGRLMVDLPEHPDGDILYRPVEYESRSAKRRNRRPADSRHRLVMAGCHASRTVTHEVARRSSNRQSSKREGA